MDCKIPEIYRKFEYNGKQYEATESGRGEFEIMKGEMGFVQYHGIYHTFPAEKAPPRPVMDLGNISGMCRAFMNGDRRSFVTKVKKEIMDPVVFDNTNGTQNFSFGRRNLQRAVLDHLHVGSLVVGKESPSTGTRIEKMVLVNPSFDTLNALRAQEMHDYDVLFRSDQAEREDPELRDGFQTYVTLLRGDLQMNQWGGREHRPEENSSRYFYYCGYNCEFWTDYENSMAIELDPNAYVATGRKFDSIEETEAEIQYSTRVMSHGIARCVRGKYSRRCDMYRYTPDVLKTYFKETKDVTSWGMHGVLISFPVPEWNVTNHYKKVPVVRGASMLSARGVDLPSAREVQELVASTSGLTVRGRYDRFTLYPKLEETSKLYNTTRYYIFDHANIVVDSGKRENLTLDQHGPVEFMGLRYRKIEGGAPDLILRRDSRGLVKYKDVSYMVVWHESFNVKTPRHGYRRTMIPQTSLVHYVTGPPMFCQDAQFDLTSEVLI